jgi:hypothetical protein
MSFLGMQPTFTHVPPRPHTCEKEVGLLSTQAWKEGEGFSRQYRMTLGYSF